MKKECDFCGESDDLLLALSKLSEDEAISHLDTMEDDFLSRISEAAKIRSDQCQERAENFKRAAQRIEHVRVVAKSHCASAAN